MRQQTFAEGAFEVYAKHTRRAAFLADKVLNGCSVKANRKAYRRNMRHASHACTICWMTPARLSS